MFKVSGCRGHNLGGTNKLFTGLGNFISRRLYGDAGFYVHRYGVYVTCPPEPSRLLKTGRFMGFNNTFLPTARTLNVY